MEGRDKHSARCCPGRTRSHGARATRLCGVSSPDRDHRGDPRQGRTAHLPVHHLRRLRRRSAPSSGVTAATAAPADAAPAGGVTDESCCRGLTDAADRWRTEPGMMRSNRAISSARTRVARLERGVVLTHEGLTWVPGAVTRFPVALTVPAPSLQEGARTPTGSAARTAGGAPGHDEYLGRKTGRDVRDHARDRSTPQQSGETGASGLARRAVDVTSTCPGRS